VNVDASVAYLGNAIGHLIEPFVDRTDDPNSGWFTRPTRPLRPRQNVRRPRPHARQQEVRMPRARRVLEQITMTFCNPGRTVTAIGHQVDAGRDDEPVSVLSVHYGAEAALLGEAVEPRVAFDPAADCYFAATMDDEDLALNDRFAERDVGVDRPEGQAGINVL
jgi:hypothetical protein